MTWIFKGDNGKYLHHFEVGLYGRIEGVRWCEYQDLAWRFHDRNVISSVIMRCGAAGSIRKLVPKKRPIASGKIRIQVRGDEHLCWEGSFDEFKKLMPFCCQECETGFDAADLVEHASAYLRPASPSEGDADG